MHPEWIIVDGYELMFRGLKRDCGLKAARDERARSDLSGLLARYAAYRQCRMSVVYEGDDKTDKLPAETRVGPATVILTRDRRKAWKEIERMAASSANPNGVMLVASHPALGDLCGKIGCVVVEPRGFFDQVQALLDSEGSGAPGEPHEKYSEVSNPAEVQMWKNIFSKPPDNRKR
ncbi:MAG TPA: NYN domain-containing protein [Candidatus Brocadiia bacterium]|nr:NYN domain-containing protein [Candidatus Brocadiia bacterium]